MLKTWKNNLGSAFGEPFLGGITPNSLKAKTVAGTRAANALD